MEVDPLTSKKQLTAKRQRHNGSHRTYGNRADTEEGNETVNGHMPLSCALFHDVVSIWLEASKALWRISCWANSCTIPGFIIMAGGKTRWWSRIAGVLAKIWTDESYMEVNNVIAWATSVGMPLLSGKYVPFLHGTVNSFQEILIGPKNKIKTQRLKNSRPTKRAKREIQKRQSWTSEHISLTSLRAVLNITNIQTKLWNVYYWKLHCSC
jgi:hypothetical protein